MKKLILTLSILLILPISAFANACAGDCSTTNNTYNTYNKYIHKTFKQYINETNESYTTINQQSVPNEYGIKVDAPYLVEFNNDWYFGVEGGKDIYNTSSDEGWFGYGKITFMGTLFSFSKGK